MDAKSFIEQFRFSGEKGWATDGDIDQIKSFIAQTEDSARLWNFCGDAIQISDSEPSRYTLDDSRECYETAVKKFPDDFEGYESLGFWHDVHGELELAASYFKLSIERGNSEATHTGLARVFAELGRMDECLAVLAKHPNQDSLELRILRDEIEDGYWSA